MASSRTATLNSPSAPQYDNYWALNTYQNGTKSELLKNLEGKGFTFRADIRKADLVEVQQRLDCGLLHYQDKRIADKELRRFIKDRGLPKPVASTRKAMVSVLLGADEALHFDKFVDLPPELRERIYQFHISSLPERLFCPTQPPITRACKLFRTEALPIFHKLATFELRFYFVNDKYQVGDDLTKAKLRPCFQTSQFLHTLSWKWSGARARLDRILIYVMDGSMRDMLSSAGKVMAWCSYQTLRTTREINYEGKSIRRGKNLLSKLERFQKPVLSVRPYEQTFNSAEIHWLRDVLQWSVL